MKLNITRAFSRPAGAAAGLFAGGLAAARLPAHLPAPQYTTPLALGIVGYMLDGMQSPTIRSAGVAIGGMAWLSLMQPFLTRFGGA